MLKDLAHDPHVASGQLGSVLSFKNPSLRRGEADSHTLGGREGEPGALAARTKHTDSLRLVVGGDGGVEGSSVGIKHRGIKGQDTWEDCWEKVTLAAGENA